MDTVLFLMTGQITKIEKITDNKLKGVDIIFKNYDSGEITKNSTDEKGNYKIWGEEGEYLMEISYLGLDKIILKRLKLESGEIRQIDAMLVPGTYYEMKEK